MRRLEPVALVEAVRIGAFDVARELDAIAAEILGPTDGVIEEVVADTAIADIFGDVDRLDLGAAPATVLEVTERVQLQHADDASAEFGHHEVRPIGRVDLVERVGIVLEVEVVIDVDAELAAEQQPDELFDVFVERISQVQLHREFMLPDFSDPARDGHEMVPGARACVMASTPDGGTDELFAAAVAAHANAHCPYSGYRVGAALRTASGAVFSGCNVENAAYPNGTCAEAGAIAAMVLAGERQIAEMVTVTSGDHPGTPCGGCRQRLREFSGPDVRVHAATVDGGLAGDRVVSHSMATLLPDSFGPDDLG